MTDEAHKENPDPQVRVVDRRWWARQQGEATSSDTGDPRKPSYVEDLERRVAEHSAQLLAMSADHRRALEEFEQVKVRIRRDIGREVERGRRAVLVELLEVLDNLDRAIAAVPRAVESDALIGLLRGVELVRDQFLAKLGGFGVSRLEALHQPFDATRHEAVTTTPVADPSHDGIIVAVMKEGYAIGDEVLRAAAVVVGKHG